ncbi:MAG: hypothetical protein [Bacteriophage sp.]|nr:MAG: hypothetical protein [Bacteriophage sp.]
MNNKCKNCRYWKKVTNSTEINSDNYGNCTSGKIKYFFNGVKKLLNLKDTPQPNEIILTEDTFSCNKFKFKAIVGNFQQIFANRYYIKNQNGFINALAEYLEADKSDIKDRINYFPTRYPCEIYILSNPISYNETGWIVFESPDGNLKGRK